MINSDDVVTRIELAVAPRSTFGADWQDHLRPAADVGTEEIRRHHADDRERHAVESSASDRSRPAARRTGAAQG